MIEQLVAATVSLMVAASPPGRSFIADAIETEDAGRTRYEKIARDVHAVAFDPEEKPLYRGPHGRVATAATLLAVAYYESGFRRDVDSGQGKLARGDDGRSCTIFQLHLGTGSTREGWKCSDVLADRRKATRAALDMMRRSFAACRTHGPEALLRVYASGSCDRGAKESKARMLKAREWTAALRQAAKATAGDGS